MADTVLHSQGLELGRKGPSGEEPGVCLTALSQLGKSYPTPHCKPGPNAQTDLFWLNLIGRATHQYICEKMNQTSQTSAGLK